MMYDEKFLVGYAKRIKNIYSKTINKENNFTLTFSLFCGLVAVIDNNVRREIFSKIDLPDYIKPTKNELYSKYNETEKLATLRHFRNSLCHFKTDGSQIIADRKKNISKIIFRDKYPSTEKYNFECTLSVEELNNFFMFMLDKIINSRS